MKQLLDAINHAKARNTGGTRTAILDTVRQWKGTGENLLGSLGDWVTDIEKRERDLNAVTESLEKRFKDLEKMERELEGRKAELALKEGQLGPLLKDFTKEVELKEEKLDEQLKKVTEHIESLEVAEREVQELKLRQSEKLKEIEKKEREVELMSGSLAERLTEFEVREKVFDSFRDGKLRELVLKEEGLRKKREEFVEEVNLADEKFKEGKKMGCGLIKRLESALSLLEGVKATVDQRIKEIELREAAAHKVLTVAVNEAELIRERLEERFEEFEKMVKEFSLSQKEKMQKLQLKDQHTNIIREELLQEFKLMDEKVSGQQKLGELLLERLEELMTKKLVEMGSLQLTLNVTSETFRAQDSHSNGESVDVRLQELKKREGEFHLYQGKKERELELKEEKLRMVLEQFIREVKYREEIFDEQEKLFFGLLKRLESAQSKIEDMNKILRERFKEREFSLVESCAEPVGLVDFKRPVDVKRLEMVINNSEKDLELMADEVSEVLRQSPDPAKLVLNAIERFNTGGDRKENTRRTHILLLDQLTKRSPNIQPCVRDAAIKLATEWKSKMKGVDVNSLQVLEFLHLLAAYKLPSLFDKDELLSFLKVVAQHEHTPELIRILDFTDQIIVMVQNLINEKQYLLASTYIQKFELEKVFPQAAVINFYVRHVKMLAMAKLKNEHSSSEAKFKAIFEEKADLRKAIEHVVKHGLESEYSPDILMEMIKQLESNLASMKNGIVSSLSTDVHKWGMGERSPQLQDANKRKAQQNEDRGADEAVRVADALLPEQGSGRVAPFGEKTPDRRSKTKKRRGSQSFHEPLRQEEKGTEPFYLSKVANNEPFRCASGSQPSHLPEVVYDVAFRLPSGSQHFHPPEAVDNRSFRYLSGSQPHHLPEVADSRPSRRPSGSRKRHRRCLKDMWHHGPSYEHHRVRH